MFEYKDRMFEFVRGQYIWIVKLNKMDKVTLI
jgi:hypothetical protein